jgi:hypothetical protein
VKQQLDSDLRKSSFWVVVRKMRESAENVVRMGEREARRGRGSWWQQPAGFLLCTVASSACFDDIFELGRTRSWCLEEDLQKRRI